MALYIVYVTPYEQDTSIVDNSEIGDERSFVIELLDEEAEALAVRLDNDPWIWAAEVNLLRDDGMAAFEEWFAGWKDEEMDVPALHAGD